MPPIKDEKYSDDDLVRLIDHEGFDYTFVDYISIERIGDDDTRRLAQVYVDAHNALSAKLEL